MKTDFKDKIINGDSLEELKKIPRETFDLIFADPPYNLQLKNELTTIVMTQTSTGPNARDRWDTPEVKLQNGKKGRLRKDRYSSLVIANMLARQIRNILGPSVTFDVVGGNRKDMVKSDGDLYKGPSWFTSAVNDESQDIYKGIYRN